jgi:hypothetical protein
MVIPMLDASEPTGSTLTVLGLRNTTFPIGFDVDGEENPLFNDDVGALIEFKPPFKGDMFLVACFADSETPVSNQI